MAHFSLRAKSLVALTIACLIVLVPAGLLAWFGLEHARKEFSALHAENLTRLNRQQVLTPLAVDLTLSRLWAATASTREWLRNENDPAARARFLQDTEGVRQALRDQAYSISSAATRNYYFVDSDNAEALRPHYVLSRDQPGDSWFFDTLAGQAEYNLNVNYDRGVDLTRVWVNVPVRDPDGTDLGVAGATIDLTEFLRNLEGADQEGVTPIMFDDIGSIQAHPDPRRIAYNTGAGTSPAEHSIFASLGTAQDAERLQQAMREAREHPQRAIALQLTLDGRAQQFAVAHIPELHWYSATAVDPRTWGGLEQQRWAAPAVAALLLILMALLLVAALLVERLVLRPIRRLQTSARAIADGRYDVSLPEQSSDEIGELSRTFGEMSQRVRSNTEDLERRVRERTEALQAANDAMSAAQRQINASIDYASLIQRAILPDRQLTRFMGDQYFVLWRPRDVVGGDFYIFQQDGENCLLGLIDCAGHGVPGALMTMLARAALDHAIQEAGAADPAGVLERCDNALRAMLADSQLPKALATNADAGLVYIDRQRQRLTYAGARIDLYASDGRVVQRERSARRALMDRRRGEYVNLELPLQPGWTYYLVTDGFLDQAGGARGLGFGDDRFEDLLCRNAQRPASEQAEAFARELAAYQGDNPQRDDITLLCFRSLID